MNKIIYFFILVSLLSCGKDGETGPQGEKGDQGIKGVDGSTLLYGTADPTYKDGKVGDFYFNTSTMMMFGPKADSGWQAGFKIKGENGYDGIDGGVGGKILRGEVAPDTTLGEIGDYYFNTKNGDFYGPKKYIMDVVTEEYVVKEASWGDPISLQPTKPQNVKLYLMSPEFKNDIKLVGLEVEAYSQKGIIDVTSPFFLEFFYHVRQSGVTYPDEIFLLNWNQLWVDPMEIEDITLPSGKILKNVKLTLIGERIDEGYSISYKLNATLPDSDTSEISGHLFDSMTRVYNYLP